MKNDKISQALNLLENTGTASIKTVENIEAVKSILREIVTETNNHKRQPVAVREVIAFGGANVTRRTCVVFRHRNKTL